MFHLTSAQRWASMAAIGEIVPLAELVRRGLARHPASSPARAPWDKVVHELVWLTVNPLPRDRWLDAGEEYKGDVIVTVDSHAEPWTTFARRRGIPERYLTQLRMLGNPAEWMVSTQPIAAAGWRRVQEGRAGHVLWERGAPLADALFLCVGCKRALTRGEALDVVALGPLCAECVARREPEATGQAAAARGAQPPSV